MPAPIGAALAEALAGRFELGEELGRGSMGVVLRARDLSSGREVALKLLLEARAGDDDARRARFQREGELVARLDHPGIVRLEESGEALGVPWLACELVPGARRLDHVFPALRPRERAGLVLELARALAHAHERGVVHRDLKPENVLVDEAGRVRLTDFGVAVARDVERLTRTGAMVGTPHYMSPEQLADGKAVGPAADVWAVGVLLYQALSGRRPFEGETLYELIDAIAARTPPPPSGPGTWAEVEAVCLAALDKDPARRPADGAAFAVALERTLRPRARDGQRWPLAVLGGVGAAATVVLASLLAGSGSGGPGGAASISSSTPDAGPPVWFRALSGPGRPPEPLPERLRPGPKPGSYLWRLTPGGEDLELRWIPWGEGEAHGFFIGADEVPARALGLGGGGPARGVAWDEAVAFCRRAGLRLPTLAEWRHAASLEGRCAHMADGVREWVQDSLPRDETVVPRWRVQGAAGATRRAIDERLVCGGTDREPDLTAPIESRPRDMLGPEDVGLRIAAPAWSISWTVLAVGFTAGSQEIDPVSGKARAGTIGRSFEELLADGGPRLELQLEELDMRMQSGGPGTLPEAAALPGAAGFPVDWFATRASASPTLDPGSWALVIHADDAVRVWVDGELLLDDWTNGIHTRDVRFTVEQRRPVELVVEHAECTWWATLEAWLDRLE